MFPITFLKVKKKSNPFNQTLTVITQVLGFSVFNDSLSNFLFYVPQYSQQPKNMSLLPKKAIRKHILRKHPLKEKDHDHIGDL